jgi:predicted ATPase
LVGPNASGKSNFLDVFRFLYDIVSIGGGFQAAVQRRGGVSKLRCLSAHRHSDVVINIGIGNNENKSIWEYEISFSDSRQIPTIKREIVKKDGEIILDRPDNEDNKDSKRLTQTQLEQVYANVEFRDIACLFSSINYLHIVPQLIRESDHLTKSEDSSRTYFGTDFVEKIARTAQKTRESRINRINKALEVSIPQFKALELKWDEATGIPHLYGQYGNWQGKWQTEDQFSDGTLRLIGILWAVMNGKGPLLLEEPELSLHPGVIRYIPLMFARIQSKTGRQILLSTHSVDLLRDDGIGLNEVLLLQADKEITTIRQANDFSDITLLLESGMNLGDIVMPKTNPPNASQLIFWGDLK